MSGTHAADTVAQIHPIETARATDRPVVASGGISSLDDITALRALTGEGVEGAIVGKALYAGAFSLQDALRVAGG